ncbi:MAG: hypothetical protein VYC34_07780, partial [Planctomycetota bacterium]|nr:hypothetical protein [Planctomycetota bacterium]
MTHRDDLVHGAADPLDDFDTRSPTDVAAILNEAAEANLTADCRHGAADIVEPRGWILATGDLHDNPLHFARVVQLAHIEEKEKDSHHLTLHEVIHSDRLMN